ncbi:MAG: hypothetical protein HYY06_16900 [Deltaproteobacteria bacterium]|nr:hypothetical protein [Deltaproteobacteria bacterium]
MLPPFIIEQIRRREEEERRRYEQPVLELPLDSPYAPLPEMTPDEEAPSDRGVIIIDSQVDNCI